MSLSKLRSHAWVTSCAALLMMRTGTDSTKAAVRKLANEKSGDWQAVEIMAEMAATAYRDGQVEKNIVTVSVNEIQDAWQNSGSALSFEEWKKQAESDGTIWSAFWQGWQAAKRFENEHGEA